MSRLIDADVKLWQLIAIINPDNLETGEFLQICKFGKDYEDFDQLAVNSPLLYPFYQYKIRTIEMIDKDVLRVKLDCDKVQLPSPYKEETK